MVIVTRAEPRSSWLVQLVQPATLELELMSSIPVLGLELTFKKIKINLQVHTFKKRGGASGQKVGSLTAFH